MFIINITYKTSLEKIDEYLKAHRDYLKEQYSRGNFIASGRKNPRTGGIILSKLTSYKKLECILNEDPFKKAEIADYEIIEVEISMTSKEYENLK
jgi:uncharacterized protein YciI